MLKKIDWSEVGYWLTILTFCLVYSFVANVQSRINLAPGSMAEKVRARVAERLEVGHRLEQKEICRQMVRMSNPDVVAIWYYNPTRNDYWCGYVNVRTVTVARAKELAPYVEVLK